MMNALVLTLKLVACAVLCYLFVFLLTGYDPASPGFRPPFLLWVMDTINLFIHEAGHLFLRPFGMFLHILGGSLVQVALPAALLVVTWRQNIGQIGYAGFWVGQSMINVSVYIQDAPVRKLRLIARGLIHDWAWLLNGNLEWAAPLAGMVYWTGILLCAASIAALAAFAVRAYREPPVPADTPDLLLRLRARATGSSGRPGVG
jgi:hypothetical protein